PIGRIVREAEKKDKADAILKIFLKLAKVASASVHPCSVLSLSLPAPSRQTDTSSLRRLPDEKKLFPQGAGRPCRLRECLLPHRTDNLVLLPAVQDKLLRRVPVHLRKTLQPLREG